MKRTLIFMVFSLSLLSTQIGIANAENQVLTATQAASIYPPTTTYSIFRKGKKIGTHTLNIDQQSDTINVNASSDLAVRILKIPVFRLNYQSTEVWEDDLLLSVSSTTKTNNTIETASLSNENGESILRYGDDTEKQDQISFATNHWNIGATQQTSLFNTIKGVLSSVSVKQFDSEPLTINDKTLNATQYQYTGDLTVSSWYDENNRWVKLEFLGSDGSTISYVIDEP